MAAEIDLPSSRLWELLQRCDLFKSINEGERTGFLHAYENERRMYVRTFRNGELVCRKGDYELALCILLSGAVEFHDDIPGQGRRAVGTRTSGEFYGELGAIGGVPRATDVVAVRDSQIFYVPDYALKFIARNEHARRILEDCYRDRMVRVLAQELDLFKNVPKAFIDELIPRCEIVRYATGGVELIRQGTVGDSLFIIRDGWVQIRATDSGVERVLSYEGPGEYIGEMALFEGGLRQASAFTAGKCELVKVLYADFRNLVQQYPQVEQTVRATIQRRHDEKARVTPELAERLTRWGELGMIQNEALLVMDLDLCVKCDNCVKACESLHGESRLIRTGIQLDKYLVPSACRHCDDPKCMTSCPTGAIKRRPEGEIYFEYDQCIGCGNCRIACPYDNIAMIESHKFDAAQVRKARTLNSRNFFRPFPVTPDSDLEPGLRWRLFGGEKTATPEPPAPAAVGKSGHVPPAFPIKCDLCDGLPLMGCVHNCPTGAAIRIEPRSLFEKTGAVSHLARVSKAKIAPERKPAKATQLAAIGSALVILLGALSGPLARHWSPYWTGAIALGMFVLAGAYSLRKRSLWFSVRWLAFVYRVAAKAGFAEAGKRLQSRLRRFDELDTWRSVHIVIGVTALLPLWWHICSAAARPNPLEWLLIIAVALLILSGFAGVVIQDFLPRLLAAQTDHEVRVEDVDSEIKSVRFQAKEGSVGHGDEIAKAYTKQIEPILYRPQPRWRLWLATLSGADRGRQACAEARKRLGSFGAQNDAYQQLLELAARKVQLEQNRSDLQFNTGWLPYHIGVAVLIAALLVFHVVAALLFG